MAKETLPKDFKQSSLLNSGNEYGGDGTISITSIPDWQGGVHAKKGAIPLIQSAIVLLGSAD